VDLEIGRVLPEAAAPGRGPGVARRCSIMVARQLALLLAALAASATIVTAAPAASEERLKQLSTAHAGDNDGSRASEPGDGDADVVVSPLRYSPPNTAILRFLNTSCAV